MVDRKVATSTVIAFSRFMSSRSGRRLFERNGYDAEAVVICAESDIVESVLERVYDHEFPVVVAIHFPTRTGQRVFGVMTVQSAKDSTPSGGQVGLSSTIGMLFDANYRDGRRTYEFRNMEPAVFGKFELAGQSGR